MTRFGAFLIHMAISLAIFAVLAVLVVFFWYPGFLFITDGGWQGLRLIGFVDLVLGPVLTLVIYKQGKPSLRKDMTAIATFQLICLSAGTFVVFSERPLALVYVDGQFFSMSAGDYRSAGVAVPDLRHLPGPRPKRVAVELPEDFAEQSEVRGTAYRSGVPLRALSERYVPLRFAALQVEREAVGYDTLLAQDAQAQQLPRWLEAHGGNLEDYAFFRFASRYVYSFLAVSREQQEIVGFLSTPGRL
ncbi:MAG: hypothetical protein ACNA7W_04530 [Pseudomonadales bacterium]